MNIHPATSSERRTGTASYDHQPVRSRWVVVAMVTSKLSHQWIIADAEYWCGARVEGWQGGLNKLKIFFGLRAKRGDEPRRAGESLGFWRQRLGFSRNSLITRREALWSFEFRLDWRKPLLDILVREWVAFESSLWRLMRETLLSRSNWWLRVGVTCRLVWLIWHSAQLNSEFIWK